MPVVNYQTRTENQVLDVPSLLFHRNRMVFLNETITDSVAADIIQQMTFLAAEDSREITLVINSPGGSVTAGLAIMDVMHGLSCPVSTFCTGLAASMAAFLLAAGEKGRRFATRHSEIMVHQILGSASGQAVDVQIAAARIARMKETIDSLLAEHTGQPIGRIRMDTDRDCFLTAPQALVYGLIDEVQDCLIP